MITDNEIRSVGVDYFTLTVPMNKADDTYQAAKNISVYLEGALRQKPWRFFGYHGYIYSHPTMGHFAYGESDNDIMGVIVQSSGMMSHRYLHMFASPAHRWTRVDLRVDVRSFFQKPCLASECYQWIVENGIRSRTYSLIKNTLGGETLYIGSRTSEEFGRMYDKGIDMGEVAGRLWRYEIELKRSKAKAAVSSLLTYMSRSSQSEAAIAVTVYDWFDKRQVPPIFRRSDTKGLDLRVQMQEELTDDTKLVWLRKQVSPTVRDMLSTGRREVLEALGILDFYAVRRKTR